MHPVYSRLRTVFCSWTGLTNQHRLPFLKKSRTVIKHPSHRFFIALDVRGDMTRYIMLARRLPDAQDRLGKTKKRHKTRASHRHGSCYGENSEVNVTHARNMSWMIDFLVLFFVFVLQSNRDSGIRSQLVNFAVKEARAAGLPICLMSLP
jgi:hypothetical protein